MFRIVRVKCGLSWFFVHLTFLCECSLTEVSVGTVLPGLVIFNVVRILDQMFFAFKKCAVFLSFHPSFVFFVLIVVNRFSIRRALYGSVFF